MDRRSRRSMNKECFLLSTVQGLIVWSINRPWKTEWAKMSRGIDSQLIADRLSAEIRSQVGRKRVEVGIIFSLFHPSVLSWGLTYNNQFFNCSKGFATLRTPAWSGQGGREPRGEGRGLSLDVSQGARKVWIMTLNLFKPISQVLISSLNFGEIPLHISLTESSFHPAQVRHWDEAAERRLPPATQQAHNWEVL